MLSVAPWGLCNNQAIFAQSQANSNATTLRLVANFASRPCTYLFNEEKVAADAKYSLSIFIGQMLQPPEAPVVVLEELKQLLLY